MAPIPDQVFHTLLISDFSIENFGRLLELDAGKPSLKVRVAPFGQVISNLLGTPEGGKPPDAAIVWTLPDKQVPGFARLLSSGLVSQHEIEAQVDQFAAALRNFSDKVRFVFVPLWVMPASHRGLGLLDLLHDSGVALNLARMNARLLDRLRGVTNVFPLNTQRWLSKLGTSAVDPRLWYMAKVPFSGPLFKEACRDVRAGLNALTGRSRKLVVLDLDNTLWGGVVGEVGWQKLRLGGHDAIGEAYVDLQRGLKALKERGILLAIASKNEESAALDAFRHHPEMILRLDDLAGWRINWNDKAANIEQLARDLNLGLDSAVFIDDNPVERARVREALPTVLVPEWPANVLLAPSALQELDCFDVASMTAEDRSRTESYTADRRRQELKTSLQSLDDWIATLEMQVRLEPLNEANLQRACQLLNKTNQMNLSTRRLAQEELKQWAERPNRSLWTCRVADRLGDSGLTGILSLEIDGACARIVDFVLSCRVMARRVEESMLWFACQQARKLGAAEVRAEYIPTPRNNPCLSLFKSSGFGLLDDSQSFVWNLEKEYPKPAGITIETA